MERRRTNFSVWLGCTFAIVFHDARSQRALEDDWYVVLKACMFTVLPYCVPVVYISLKSTNIYVHCELFLT